MRGRGAGGVSRVRFIEIVTTTAWLVDGELWRFRDGTEVAVGDANDLDSRSPMVTAPVALGLINAGKAEALSIADLDAPDLETSDPETSDDFPADDFPDAD